MRVASVLRSLTSLAGAAILLLAGTAPMACAAPNEDATSTAAAFGALPKYSHLALSPNGNLLAWGEAIGDEVLVSVNDLVAKHVKRTVRLGGGLKLRALAWADDATLLVTESGTLEVTDSSGKRKYEFSRTVAVDPAPHGAQRILLMNGGDRVFVTGADLLSLHAPAPGAVIMSSLDFTLNAYTPSIGTHLTPGRRGTGWVRSAYTVDLRTGAGRVLEPGDAFTEDWSVDSHGRVRARSEWNPKEHHYRVQAKDGRGWRTIFESSDDSMVLEGVLDKSSSLLAIAPGKSGHRELWALPLDGSPHTVMLADPALDVEEVIRDRFTGSPVAAYLGGAEGTLRWFDPAAEASFAAISRSFPGRNVELFGRSADGSRVIARVQSPSSPPIYYLIDLKTHRADIVGEEYPQLANVKLGEVRIIRYPARDGTEIPAYLTLPPESKGDHLPLVVLPHGGPQARDEFAFDWLAQFIAVRGYAVLQPQFRGSTGFGEAFRRAGEHQWGRLMQDDVTDGAKAMIGQGLADASRICIVGGSYGGYAALAGAAFTPHLYACAASIGGLSDLPAFLQYQRIRSADGDESDVVAYWREDIGSSFDPNVIAASPARAAEHVRADVLLIHATDDTIVSIAQSEEMARALQSAGKRVNLVRLPGEDHWLSTAAMRTRTLEELGTFLDAHLRMTSAPGSERQTADH